MDPNKGPVIRATFSRNLSRNNVAVASCDCLLRVLAPSRATNCHVAESRCRFYFLQHKNLLREKVVIRATNNHNLQRQHCCATSCTKMLPVLLDLNKQTMGFPCLPELHPSAVFVKEKRGKDFMIDHVTFLVEKKSQSKEAQVTCTVPFFLRFISVVSQQIRFR